MRVKLSSDDRCAIDMVLEHRTNGDGNLPYCFGKNTATLRPRVQKVEQIFDLIAQCPVEEPPANLVASTIKFVKRHAHDVPAAHPVARRPIAVSQTTHRPLH